jgi:hypothetical protein
VMDVTFCSFLSSFLFVFVCSLLCLFIDDHVTAGSAVTIPDCAGCCDFQHSPAFSTNYIDSGG